MNVNPIEYLDADAIQFIVPEEDAATAQEASIETLITTIETQQRWIKLLCDRATTMASTVQKEKETESKVDGELFKLEAGLGAMSKISIEIAEKWRLSEEEMIRRLRKSDQSVEILQRELEEVQEDRIRGEVEAVRRAKALEETFEKLVAEKEAELVSLRQLNLENEEIRTQLEEACLMGRPNIPKESKGASSKIENNVLLMDTLKALWQITSDSHLISGTLQGAPKLLEHICKSIEFVMTENMQKTVLALSAATITSAPLNQHHLAPYHCGIQYLPPMCGFLVNVASTSEGRKQIAETASGSFLSILLELLSWLSSCASAGVPSSPIGKSEESYVFDRKANRNGRKLPQSAPREHKNNSVELLLCLLSNLSTDKEVAVRLLSAGMIERIDRFVQVEKAEPLRRYAVRLIRSVVELIPWVPSSTIVAQTYGQTKSVSDQELESGVGDCFKQAGDFITLLSRDAGLKMLGLELLGALQAVMPMEE